MLGMLRSLAEMLCHPRSQPAADGWWVAGGGVGAERVQELTYYYRYANYCTFLIKTWPHVKFASGRNIKDGNFS